MYMRKLAAFLVLALAGFAPQQQAPEYPPVAEVREAFLKQLDRPKVKPDLLIVDTTTEAKFVTEVFTIATEKKRSGRIERLPVLLVRPEKVDWKMPAVVVLHGTGGNKESQRGLCLQLAKKGIIGIAIDARYHGARAEGEKGATRYVAAITEAWKSPVEEMEHPFYYDTVWDLWRLADYLETRPDIDAKRLGMIGFSMGGIQTWLAASVDERWKVAVPAIGVQSFKWSLENDRWQGRARGGGEGHRRARSEPESLPGLMEQSHPRDSRAVRLPEPAADVCGPRAADPQRRPGSELPDRRREDRLRLGRSGLQGGRLSRETEDHGRRRRGA